MSTTAKFLMKFASIAMMKAIQRYCIFLSLSLRIINRSIDFNWFEYIVGGIKCVVYSATRMGNSAVYGAVSIHPSVHRMEFSQHHRHSAAITAIDTRSPAKAALLRNVPSEPHWHPTITCKLITWYFPFFVNANEIAPIIWFWYGFNFYFTNFIWLRFRKWQWILGGRLRHDLME